MPAALTTPASSEAWRDRKPIKIASVLKWGRSQA